MKEERREREKEKEKEAIWINAIICTCISQKRKRHIVDGISSQQTTRIFFFVLIHINFLSRLDYFHRLWLMRHVQKSSMFEFQRCSSRSIGNSHVLWTSTTFSPVIITERECSQSIGIFQLLTRALRALGNRISTFVFFKEE